MDQIEYLKSVARSCMEKEIDWPELARVIYLLKKNLPHAEWKKFYKDIGLGDRHSYYLIELQEKAILFNITLPADVSWRLLAEASTIITWRNAEEIFSLCRKLTREQFKRELKNRKL